VFSAFGPLTGPRYQVSAILAESGFGGTAAAPIVRSLFDVFSGAAPLPPAPLGGVGEAVGALPSVGGSYD